MSTNTLTPRRHWSQDLLDSHGQSKDLKLELSAVCSPLGQINCVKNLLEFLACAVLLMSSNFPIHFRIYAEQKKPFKWNSGIDLKS